MLALDFMHARRRILDLTHGPRRGALYFAARTGLIESALNFQKKRRKPIKAPTVSFMELLAKGVLLSGSHDIGHGELAKTSYAIGRYQAENLVRMFKAMGKRYADWRNREVSVPISREEYWAGLKSYLEKHPEENMDLRGKPRQDDDLNGRAGDWEGPRPGGAGGAMSKPSEPEFSVRFTPASSKNRVGSNHVGPDHQVEVYDGPWPVAGPGAKVIAISSARERKPGALTARSHRKPLALAAPPAEEKSKGESAADKARAKVVKMTAKKKDASSPSKPRRRKSKTEPEL